ncbi:MAG: DUF5318 family protein [Acidimicrobiales bacterium]
MHPGPESDAERSAPRGLGQIEYRLARDAVVREFRKGRLSRIDICDAHPELLRVARNLGQVTEIDCPICEEARVVQVAYAFGNRLPPGGRALPMNGGIRELAAHREDVAFYVVEVCTECSWNHVLRMFTGRVARRRPAV